MTTRITKPTNIFFLFILLLAACSKDRLPTIPDAPDNGGGGTPDPATTVVFRFIANADIAGQPYHSSNLSAVVSVAKENGEEVVKEQKLGVALAGNVTTETLQLPAGTYKLTSFRLEYGNVQTHFVAPKTGSAKAAAVQAPLAKSFDLSGNSTVDVNVEVLKVQTGETPQMFGYASGAFDYGQDDASPFLKVKLQAVIKIGEIVYDSVPASLTLTSWNAAGEMNTTYGSLAAGVNEVNVLKSAVKYEFRISRWGVADAITLNRADIDPQTIYVLGGSKNAKKLKSERNFKIVNNQDVADSKTDYFYDHAGKLTKIDYWMRKPVTNAPYLAMVDWFEYSGSKVTKVTRRNLEDNSVMKETTFAYDVHDKMISVSETANGFTTAGTITYLPSARKIGVTYNMSSGHTLNYEMSFLRGNVIESTAANSNGSFEKGMYSYDTNINPYIHMNWPTLFLANSSKNNVTSQSKQYSGAFPTADAYSFQFTYDADGYPTQVIKNYKSAQSGNYLFSTKTVFIY